MNHSHSGWIWLKDPVSVQETPVFGCFTQGNDVGFGSRQFSRSRILRRRQVQTVLQRCLLRGGGPCKSDNHLRYYDEVELAPYLHTGSNVVAIVVLHYPPQQCNHSVFCTPTPGVWLQSLTCDPLSGIPLLQTDATWQAIQDTGRRIVSENPFFCPAANLRILHPLPKNLRLDGSRLFVHLAQRRVNMICWIFPRFCMSACSGPALIPLFAADPPEFAGQVGSVPGGPLLHRVRVVLDAGETDHRVSVFASGRRGRRRGVELLQAECYLKKVTAAL